MRLHLQALIDGSWQRAALLEFPTAEEGRRGGCVFEYEYDYLVRWPAEPPPLAAVSLNLPIEFGPRVWRRWPAFLDDLRPMGSARGWWLRRLSLPCRDRHYLVKFARSRSERDRTILRSEYVYYKALAALGFETIPQEGLALHEGPSGPSLWLPRFDVARRDGRELRFGLESIYSLLNAEPGSSSRIIKRH